MKKIILLFTFLATALSLESMFGWCCAKESPTLNDQTRSTVSALRNNLGVVSRESLEQQQAQPAQPMSVNNPLTAHRLTEHEEIFHKDRKTHKKMQFNNKQCENFQMRSLVLLENIKFQEITEWFELVATLKRSRKIIQKNK
jgi:hypothetical protein